MAEPEPVEVAPLSLNVLLTEVRVNCGDHAQDVITALEVPENMTVGDLVRARLQPRDWRGGSTAEGIGENYITIRLAAPRGEEF